MLRDARLPLFLIACCTIASCGGGTTTPVPPPGSGNPDVGERVTGSERLGWTQSAPNRGELDAYRYAAYVDGERVAMADASCRDSIPPTYDCDAPLPKMSAGRHTLELVAVLNGMESARSAAIVLTVGSALEPMTSRFDLARPPADAPAASCTNQHRVCAAPDECYEDRSAVLCAADPDRGVLPDRSSQRDRALKRRVVA